MPQSGQRLLAGCHDLPERGTCHSLCCSLLGIQNGLVPHLAANGMVRQPLDLFGQPLRIESFDSFHYLAVKDAPALVEKASVGYIVGEGMLERILRVGADAGGGQELGTLEEAQAAPKD